MSVNLRRIVLYLVVAVLAALIVHVWVKDYPPAKETASEQQAQQGQSGASYSPATFSPETATQTRKAGASQAMHPGAGAVPVGKFISVKTDVLDVQIDRDNGSIASVQLPRYPVSKAEQNVPVQILNSNSDLLYVAQSGITNTASAIHFTAAKKIYALQNGQNELVVQLSGRTPNGLSLTKTYTFVRGQYTFRVWYEVSNRSGKNWSGSFYTQITRRKPSSEHHTFYTSSYNGAAVSSPQIPYEKVTYKDMDEKNIDRASQGGWVAMQQHYFLTAWIPADPKATYHYYSHVITSPEVGENVYVIGFVSPQMLLAPGGTARSGAIFYVGPEVAKTLRALAPGLDHTIDYGWLWPISIIIFWIMHGVYLLVRNWGWAIVITTILIKIVFYPLTAKSFRSMAKMRELQPKMQALKERYGDDRQALSKATMELYRTEKVNPLGGCLPMIIQIPVFIALYYVLIESVELRQAPFIFWVHDLSTKDPYYVLPILMGMSMLAQQWLSPTATDPTQQKMMWILPVVFTVFFVNFPSGLVLYWLVNNIVQVLQQWYVNKTFEQHKAKQYTRKKKR